MPVLDGVWSRQVGLAGSGHVVFDQRIDTDMGMAVHEIEDKPQQCLTGPLFASDCYNAPAGGSVRALRYAGHDCREDWYCVVSRDHYKP